MRAGLVAAAAGVLALGAWQLLRVDQAEGDQAEGDGATWSDLGGAFVRAFQTWRAPAQYAATIAQAEAANGIPAGMLERLLYQECRWRADIISGATRSSVGAMGIAQFMPATAAEMGINPLDPQQAIPAAGRYLARLFRATGTWTRALASYNWGQGNVQRKGLQNAPTETRNYYTEILADVNAAGGTNYA